MNPLTNQELDRLMATNSPEEWKAVCEDIKKARNGQYPEDWWPKVMVSGIYAGISGSWKTRS